MSATLIDGHGVAAAVREEVRRGVVRRCAAGYRPPALRVILVGTDPASEIYVRAKTRAGREVGIDVETSRLPEAVSASELGDAVAALNEDDSVDGVLVQLPLPAQLSPGDVVEALDPRKDVDGFHPVNVGRLIAGESGFRSCTPAAVMTLLAHYGVDTEGAHVVVVGASRIVGRPAAVLLGSEEGEGKATVTVCHKFTKDLARHVRSADIVVAAAGRPGLVTGEMVRPGAVVVDVGMNRVADARAARGYVLKGDCEFESVRERASLITPVPGGVGPVTVAMLLRNTLLAAERSAHPGPTAQAEAAAPVPVEGPDRPAAASGGPP